MSRTWKSKERRTWGNHFYFFNFDKRKIAGWLTPSPEVGDIFEVEMVSGRTAKFKAVSVEIMRDPPDMFFATVKDVGYAEIEKGERP